jgi:hypothetical protein
MAWKDFGRRQKVLDTPPFGEKAFCGGVRFFQVF